MPPNPASNSRLPRLAVWSGYGTECTRFTLKICIWQKKVLVVLACQAFGVFVSLVFLVSSSVENKQIAQVLVVFLENHLFVIRVS